MHNRQAAEYKSFIIHLWLEAGLEKPAWRGRVTDGDSEDSRGFEDGRSLLGFIRGRLREISKISLPIRRGRP